MAKFRYSDPGPTDATKECTKCKQVLPLWHFFKNRYKPDRIHNVCRKCFSEARIARNAGTPSEKRCSTCKEIKPAEAFSLNKCAHDGLQNVCKDCLTKHNKKKWQEDKSDPEAMQSRYAKNTAAVLTRTLRHYGVSRETYDALVLAGCGICGGDVSSWHNGGKSRRRFSFDHDHVTGKFRGLLCSTCNRAIGLFKDSPALVKKALEYLERNQ